MKRRLFIVLLCSFLLSFSFRVGASVDFDAIGSITADLKYNNVPLSGSSLTLYAVGDLVWEDDEYRVLLKDDYRDSDLPVTDLHTKDVAFQYDAFTKKHDVQGATETADTNGRVLFSSLPVGVYLVSGFQSSSDNLTMDPFLVTVPYLVDGEFVYEMNANPKVSLDFDYSQGDRPETPDNPSDDPENDVEFPDGSKDPEGDEHTPNDSEKIPQTGQLKWPVPVLSIGGLTLVFVGWWMLLDRGKKPHDEA